MRVLKSTLLVLGFAFCVCKPAISQAPVADSFTFPLNVPWTTSQAFDVFENDTALNVGPGFHLGEDVFIPVPKGGLPSDTELPVIAAGNGIVRDVNWHKGYGNVVIIEHQLPLADPLGPTVTTLYGHLRQKGLIAVNKVVQKGDVIGFLSSVASENGGYPYTHLHFEVRKGNFATGCDPTSNWWVYAGYSTLFRICNLGTSKIQSLPDDPRHAIVVSHFTSPSDFIRARLSTSVTHLSFSRTDIATGINGAVPRAIVVGDFNGDGIPDLAVSNLGSPGSSSISIFLGKGDGTFGPQSDFGIGASSVTLAARDFNGDGRLDLVESHLEAFNLSILLGSGIGTFAAPQEIAFGSGDDHIIADDFNRDGHIDLASNTAFGTVGVLLGNGHGGFGAVIRSAAPTFTGALATGDFNGDGIPDLAVTNTLSNNVNILLGKGDGSFLPPITLVGVDGLHDSIVVADFNQDQKLDVAVTTAGTDTVTNPDQDSVSVWLGNGDATFSSPQVLHTGPAPFAMVSGDLDGDGKLDLAVATISGDVSVLLGKGDGTFEPKQDFAVGLAPQAIAIGDFNRDGKLDLAVANGGSKTISILMNVSH